MSWVRAFEQMHLVHQLHPVLEWEAFFIVIHVLVTLHLDHGNMLCMGLFLKSIWKVQLVQNDNAGIFGHLLFCCSGSQ